MKKIKNMRTVAFLAAVFVLPLILTACDGGDCYTDDNYKSVNAEKSLPGTQPSQQTDC